MRLQSEIYDAELRKIGFEKVTKVPQSGDYKSHRWVGQRLLEFGSMIMKRRFEVWMWTGVVCMGVFGFSNTHAQSITTSDLSSAFFLTGDGLAYGGAFRAVADTAQATLYNPAGIAQQEGKMLARLDYGNIGGTDSTALGISLVDFQTSKSIAYGVSYHRNNPTLGGNQGQVNQILLSGGKRMGSFMVGASAKGYWVNLDNPLLEGPKGVDMDIGFLFQPLPILSVAFTAHNIFRGHSIEEFPFILGGGFSFRLADEFRVMADFTKDFQTPNSRSFNSYFGAEFFVSPQFSFRGGYGLDRVQNNDFYSLGATAGSEVVKIHFTFSQRVSPKSEIYAGGLEFYF
ncbi:MAG: hypothetical protein R3A11_00030 [Bdellovibrionota bacterium]